MLRRHHARYDAALMPPFARHLFADDAYAYDMNTPDDYYAAPRLADAMIRHFAGLMLLPIRHVAAFTTDTLPR